MEKKVANQALLDFGLILLKQKGLAPEKVKTGSRSMQYRLPDGDTVRVRTCNDHILVVLASSADKKATLNIEGTDWLLVVMPEIERTHGKALAYLIPTDVAVDAVRQSHAAWLASKPATAGNNRTWNVWFDDFNTPWSGFANKWRKYLLLDSNPGENLSGKVLPRSQEKATLGDVIAEAKRNIAEAAGVPIDAVKISVSLE